MWTLLILQLKNSYFFGICERLWVEHKQLIHINRESQCLIDTFYIYHKKKRISHIPILLYTKIDLMMALILQYHTYLYSNYYTCTSEPEIYTPFLRPPAVFVFKIYT